jgi:hypothetical protein
VALELQKSLKLFSLDPPGSGNADGPRRLIEPSPYVDRAICRLRQDTAFNDLIDAARKNPIQAAAVCGSLAYPLFRLVRTVPLLGHGWRDYQRFP